MNDSDDFAKHPKTTVTLLLCYTMGENTNITFFIGHIFIILRKISIFA